MASIFRVEKISSARNQREACGNHLATLTLKMEAMFSSETSVDTQRTTRRYIPEDGTLQIRNILKIVCRIPN
jgi:hypothetical protein